MQALRLASDADFRVAFHHLHQRVERGGVLPQALVFVKCEERRVASGFFDNL